MVWLLTKEKRLKAILIVFAGLHKEYALKVMEKLLQ